MATSYPSGYDTETTGSLGVDKANTDPVVTPSLNNDAAEYNNIKGAVRQLELKVGDGASVLTRNADADKENVREYMDFMMNRSDKAGYHDHFTYVLLTVAALAGGGAVSVAQRSGGIGVYSQTSVAGVATGLATAGATNIFHQRSSYCRFRVQLETIAFGPWANGDTIRYGLWRDATHYVIFESVAAGGVFPNWTVEINDGGSTDSTTLTTGPDTSWHVFEILTTDSGAYFYLDRNTASEEYAYLNGQAPENGYCDQRSEIDCTNVAAATCDLYSDEMSCQDTRTL
jgi:hypothetical protein